MRDAQFINILKSRVKPQRAQVCGIKCVFGYDLVIFDRLDTNFGGFGVDPRNRYKRTDEIKWRIVTTPRPKGRGFLFLRLQLAVCQNYASLHKQRRIALPPLVSGYLAAEY